MPKTSVYTEDAPKAIGPYSQAVRVGELLFVSGQLPVNPQNQEIVQADIEAQTRQVLENLRAILRVAHADFSHVVKVSIFLSSMDYFPKVNNIYATYFNEPFPARETVAVKTLPKQVDIEIALIASFVD